MGMLMHHTWLAQQKPVKPVEKKTIEKIVEEPKESEPVSVKRTGGRPKKTSK